MPYFSEWLAFIEVARRLTEKDPRYWGQLLDAINDGNVRVRLLHMAIEDRIPPTAFRHQYLTPGTVSSVVVYRPDLTRYWPTAVPDPYDVKAENKEILRAAIQEISQELGPRGTAGVSCADFDTAVWTRLGLPLNKGKPPRGYGSRTIARIVAAMPNF